VTAAAPVTTARDTEDGGLRSVSIAMTVLGCFAGHAELGPTRVAAELGIAKSTASRMLAALAAGGMLERATGGRYRLSLGLYAFGQLAVDRLPLRAVARPVLVELNESLREMVQLGVPVGGHVLYVERVGHGGSSRFDGEVMRRVPGYSSSAGRVMAAFDPAIARAMGSVGRRKHTPFTITDPMRLDRILRSARSAGWVSSLEEYELGYSSVAAPIFTPDGGVAGAISAVGPTGHVTALRKDFVVASMCRAARRITALLAQSEDS
jgi:IclR family KDG regulon transcriptional repressor